MIKWSVRFLKLAKEVSYWSKDPSTGVGAVIADRDNRIVSIGYNGFPKGILDTDERLQNRELKLKLTIHAEENAIFFAEGCKGMTIYITAPPCVSCACKIIQSGIKKVICIPPTDRMLENWGEDFILSKQILQEAAIPYLEVCNV